MLAAVLVVVGLGLAFTAWSITRVMKFEAPHRVTESRARIEATLATRDLANPRAPTPQTVEPLIEAALEETASHLHFGLNHRTNMSFASGEREGNCIEYSNLFARLFNLRAKAARLNAHAYSVHSTRATVLGARIPLRGWSDHDWTLIVERDQGGREIARHFVDPTLFDMGLPWQIAASVRGELRLPPVRPN